MDEKLEGLAKKLGPKKQWVIFIAGLAGILLIAFAKLPSGEVRQVSAQPEVAEPTAQSYEQQLEERLETILASIAGVGRVRVMVTLESGYGYEYAKENKTNSDHLADIRDEENQKTQEKSTLEESYVMVEGKGGGKSPLITKELEPMVKGVVIVCEGGSNPVTVTSIIDTVRVAVNISSAQISVSKMVQNQP